MPVLNTFAGFEVDGRRPIWGIDGERDTHEAFTGRCANPACHSGWLRLFRRRSRPVFEGGWTCSPECTEECLQSAVQRELNDRSLAPKERHHRVPIGLIMLEKGWITRDQLTAALDAQKRARTGRLGDCLVRLGSTDEAHVARALGLQWSCPVLSIDSQNVPASISGVMPRLFLDAFGALPIRVQAGQLLYLGFDGSLDPVLAYALERMTGLDVACGVATTSEFRLFQVNLLKETFPALQLAEAASASAAAHMLAKTVERMQPAASRLVRVHDFLWLRMLQLANSSWSAPISSIRDLVCTIGAF